MTKPRPTRPVEEATIEVPRTARYYTMGRETAIVDELWFVLHGFGQLAREFVQFFGDIADGRRLVIAPEALNRYYSAGSTSVPATERTVGATWMTREDRHNEITDYVRYLDLLHERFATKYPAAKTVAVGFSQGGATASRWAMLGRAHIDRLILWGATVPPDADLHVSALRGAALSMVVGRSDQYITPGVLAAERARLTAAGVKAEVIEYDGGHAIKRSVLRTLVAS